MLHSWRDREREKTEDARKRKRANAEYACSEVETCWKKGTIVALLPRTVLHCWKPKTKQRKKATAMDGWMDGVGRSKVHDPSRFVSPTAIVVFSCRCRYRYRAQHKEIDEYSHGHASYMVLAFATPTISPVCFCYSCALTCYRTICVASTTLYIEKNIDSYSAVLYALYR